jgi:hypothetical protein
LKSYLTFVIAVLDFDALLSNAANSVQIPTFDPPPEWIGKTLRILYHYDDPQGEISVKMLVHVSEDFASIIHGYWKIGEDAEWDANEWDYDDVRGWIDDVIGKKDAHESMQAERQDLGRLFDDLQDFKLSSIWLNFEEEQEKLETLLLSSGLDTSYVILTGAHYDDFLKFLDGKSHKGEVETW